MAHWNSKQQKEDLSVSLSRHASLVRTLNGGEEMCTAKKSRAMLVLDIGGGWDWTLRLHVRVQ